MNDIRDLAAETKRAEDAEAKLAAAKRRNDDLRASLAAYLVTIKRLQAKDADREADKAELAALKARRCERCARHDVTNFCSRWNRCSYPDDGCSYFTKREAT